ncbi:unnamed protein product [Hermetia illucens]|uniref:Uncharacterized protein n=1 Tax=Hermetia illucens TaxID=343691 RepID=A0A7R8V3F0_HERIL|nr:unnamed protein product [Hermetia illucens]
MSNKDLSKDSIPDNTPEPSEGLEFERMFGSFLYIPLSPGTMDIDPIFLDNPLLFEDGHILQDYPETGNLLEVNHETPKVMTPGEKRLDTDGFHESPFLDTPRDPRTDMDSGDHLPRTSLTHNLGNYTLNNIFPVTPKYNIKYGPSLSATKGNPLKITFKRIGCDVWRILTPPRRSVCASLLSTSSKKRRSFLRRKRGNAIRRARQAARAGTQNSIEIQEMQKVETGNAELSQKLKGPKKREGDSTTKAKCTKLKVPKESKSKPEKSLTTKHERQLQGIIKLFGKGAIKSSKGQK